MVGDLRGLRKADLRFVLPSFPRRAVVLGDLPDWHDGLAAAGVDVVEPGTDADVVVTTPGRAREAEALDAEQVLVTGTVRRLPGRHRRRVLTLPDRAEPQLVVDPRQRVAAGYAGSLLPRRARVAAPVLRAGIPVPGPSVTVVARHPGRPALLTAAVDLGLGDAGQWFLALGSGGIRRRGVFYSFPPRSSVPAHVVKFGRVPGRQESFDRDERGLRLALAAGPVVADRAPRLVGRGEACGLPASVETALPGAALAPSSPVVEEVVDWLRRVARATATPRPGGVPTVFRHGDVFPGNVVVDGSDFGLVDWENAEASGRPLADLLFFAAHVLGDDPVATFVGSSPTSAVLARWLRAAAADLGLTGEQVRGLASDTWRDHGSHAVAARLRREQATGRPVVPYLAERLATAWATHPQLGEHWRPW